VMSSRLGLRKPGQFGSRRTSGRICAQAVSNEVRNGWRIESQTDYNAYLVRGQRTSHGLHIFVSVITLGLWLPVYAVMLYANRTQRLTINVDDWGNTNFQR
jgi:hypothetical protein